jgi:hypothetical protein
MRSRSKNTFVANGFKFCPECQNEKPVAEFPVRNTGKLYAYCKPCNSARTQRWSAENKERKAATTAAWTKANSERLKQANRAKHFRRKYGLTLECIEAKLSQQNSRCAICEQEIDEKTLVVDHCHGSDKVRDLLCNLCNISLAPIERDGFLTKALAYLERHRSAG